MNAQWDTSVGWGLLAQTLTDLTPVPALRDSPATVCHALMSTSVPQSLTTVIQTPAAQTPSDRSPAFAMMVSLEQGQSHLVVLTSTSAPMETTTAIPRPSVSTQLEHTTALALVDISATGPAVWTSMSAQLVQTVVRSSLSATTQMGRSSVFVTLGSLGMATRVLMLMSVKLGITRVQITLAV